MHEGTGEATVARVAANWHAVVEEVADACQRANRSVEEVTIIGVTKYVGPELAGILFEVGCADLGENRPQELWRKAAWFQSRGGDQHGARAASLPRWHVIGHLQRNKVRRTLPLMHLLHSLDSLRLVEALVTECRRVPQSVRCLIEVNIAGDASKTGVPVDELPRLVEAVREYPELEVQGLMAMASLDARGDDARRQFAALRQLRDDLQQRYAMALPHLSMGMSGDFAEAIAEGATMVRIGSRLWEGVV
ncbi:MAG: YggS family pyridoxal phosphate enzyme [Pirellulaceae bacterium]|nr:MAG: YggS family pyridoxal phosphate enzyme [Pirellulaceae bacterium]